MPKGNAPYWRVKYRNYAEMVQAVLQVEAELELSDRLFLNALAAHSVNEDPHPGNARLMRACQVKTRQGLNKISDRVCNRHRLAVMVEKGGGKHNANVYRICIEDPRFPPPKPATEELRVSEQETCNSSVAGIADETRNQYVAGNTVFKPATGEAETRNAESSNPQLEPAKPATETVQTRNSRVAPELDSRITTELDSRIKAETPLVAIAPLSVPEPNWQAFVEMRKKIRKPMTERAEELIRRELRKLAAEGHDPVEVLDQSIRNSWQDVYPLRKENRNGKRVVGTVGESYQDSVDRIHRANQVFAAERRSGKGG
jgi:hypothetical protein